MTGSRRRLGPALALGGLLLLSSACATPTCDPRPGVPSHHGPTGFCNPPGSPEPTATAAEIARDGLRLAFARHRGPIPPEHLEAPDDALAALSAIGDADHVTWLGHATLLMRLGGRTVLVDPVWSRYVTPVPPFGPKRITPPPIALEALPPIDVLLLTHDHFDHLDLATVSRMTGKDRVEVVVPLGLGATLRGHGFTRVTELDWWQEVALGALTVHALPAQHQSGRSLLSKNKTLWTSYALVPEGEGSRVYLSGDTGYRDHFAEIGERYGPFDLAVLNVGGYGPRDVAKAYHVTPAEAVKAVGDLKAASAFPIHWGTYPLGAEPAFSPGPNVVAAAREAGVAPGTIRLMRIGETRPLVPADAPSIAVPAKAAGGVPGS